MATSATLSNLLIDTTGTPAGGVDVRAQLIASSGWLDDATAEVITYGETQTGDDGTWSMAITPLDQMEDTGAYYQITEGRKQWNVSIPTAGTYTLRPQIVNTPGQTGGAGSGSGAGGGAVLIPGSVAPTSFIGNNGDVYIDTVHANLYGPKAGGVWGVAKSLVGPAGAAGGVTSVQGKTGVVTTLSPANLSPPGLLASDASVTNARTPLGHHTSHEVGAADAFTTYARVAVVTGGWKITDGTRTLWITDTDPGSAAADGDDWINNA